MASLHESIAQLSHRYRVLWNAEAATLILVFLAFYGAYAYKAIPRGLAKVSPVLTLFLVPGIQKVIRGIRKQRRLASYYDSRLARLENRWRGTGDPGDAYSDVDHPYTGDLDVFGEGSLFEYLCAARTGIGKQTLAAWLREPARADEIAGRQAAIDELRGRRELREYFAIAAADSPSSVDPAPLFEWFEAPGVAFPRAVRVLAALICAALLVSIPLSIVGLASPSAPLAIIALVAVFSLATRKRIGPILGSSTPLYEELEALAAYASRLERERVSSPLLTRLRDTFASSGNKSASRAIRPFMRIIRFMRWHQDPSFNYISHLSLWGVQFAMAAEEQRTHLRHSLAAWVRAIGEFEALNSLATYAFEHPEDPFPEIVEPALNSFPVFESVSLGHPLLPEETCVRNPVRIGSKNRFLLVSGSNMSGKSTYLRSIGTSFVLARAGAPVRASSLRLSIFSLETSMRVQDSLQDGRSRFFAEVARVRSILHRAATGPVLFLLDELLSGTNSSDRQVGAASVINQLLERSASGLLTTHDLTLAHLVDDHPGLAKNVHFIDQFENGEMRFDYRLRDGVVTRTNARDVLRLLGIL